MMKILLASFINFYGMLIFVYIMLSWVPNSKNTRFGRILSSIVEPYLSIFRNKYTIVGMFDLSAIIAILVLNFAYYGIISI